MFIANAIKGLKVWYCSEFVCVCLSKEMVSETYHQYNELTILRLMEDPECQTSCHSTRYTAVHGNPSSQADTLEYYMTDSALDDLRSICLRSLAYIVHRVFTEKAERESKKKKKKKVSEYK